MNRFIKKITEKMILTSKEMENVYFDRCKRCGKTLQTIYSIPDSDGKFIGVCHQCYLSYEAKRNRKKSSPLSVMINGKYYSMDDIKNIVENYEETNKNLMICDRCGEEYEDNNKHNIVKNGLEEKINSNKSYASGYETTPYINGFKITSTCGKGKDVKLCDKCIEDLLVFLNKKKEE